MGKVKDDRPKGGNKLFKFLILKHRSNDKFGLKH